MSIGARIRGRLAIAIACSLIGTGAFALDANTASPTELQTIRGIGPKMAQRIASERALRPFEDLDDLKERVRGIGEKKLQAMKAAGLSVAPQAPLSPADEQAAAISDALRPEMFVGYGVVASGRAAASERSVASKRSTASSRAAAADRVAAPGRDGTAARAGGKRSSAAESATSRTPAPASPSRLFADRHTQAEAAAGR